MVRKFLQTPSSGFLRINSGISFWKHRPRRKSRSGAWKHHFHLKWSKCITTETRFVMQFVRLFPYTFSTLKSLYPCHGHELQLEDQHLRGCYIQWWPSTPKNNSQERRQTKFPLPRDPLYPAFACGVGVPEIFCFSCSTRKIGGTTASQRKIELLTRRLTFNFC